MKKHYELSHEDVRTLCVLVADDAGKPLGGVRLHCPLTQLKRECSELCAQFQAREGEPYADFNGRHYNGYIRLLCIKTALPLGVALPPEKSVDK